MSDKSVEMIDAAGDRWVVRECDGDGECAIIERHYSTAHGNEVDADDWHIPLTSLGKLELAIKTFRENHAR